EGMDRDELREQAFPRAELVVWLDLSRHVVAWRLITRTALHLLCRVETHGNRETWRDLVTRQGFVRRTIAKHGRRRRQFETLLEAEDYPNDKLVRLGSRDSVRRWMRSAMVPAET
ncbi:MAG: adenylate kinase, partial [Actinomycetota bacterium]